MAKKIEIDYIKDFRLCDKGHFLIMKGIAIFLVMIAYISQTYWGMEQLLPLAGVGSVVFLFCSGYGVSESFLWKKGVPHYWENKIVKIWIPSLVVLFVASWILQNNPLGWIEHAPIGLHGWFLNMLFAYYLLFWLAVQYLDGKSAQLTVLLVASAIAFFTILKQNYAEVLLAFPLGVLFSQQGLKRSIREFGFKGRIVISLVLLLLAVGGYMLADKAGHYLLENLCWLISKTSMGLLLILGVFFLQKVQIFGIFGMLGTISYCVYLLMQQVLPLFTAPGNWQMLLIGLAVLLVLASVYSWLSTQLYYWNKNMRRKRNPKLKGHM